MKNFEEFVTQEQITRESRENNHKLQRLDRKQKARRKQRRQDALLLVVLIGMWLVIGYAFLAQIYTKVEPEVQETAPAQDSVETTIEAVVEEPEEEPEVVAEPLNATVHAEEIQEVEEELDEPDREYLGEFKITHYCACPECCGKAEDDPWYGITATGTRATEGRTIAVDPKVIPYGSEVVVYYNDGSMATYIAEDCGGAIKGNRIDVFIADHQRANVAGVKYGTVAVLAD